MNEKRQKGKWLIYGGFVKCSICGNDAPFNNYSEPVLTKFCPCCGSEMENGKLDAKFFD